MGGVSVDPVRGVQVADVGVVGHIGDADGGGGYIGGGQDSWAGNEGSLQAAEVIFGPVPLQPEVEDAGAGVVIGGDHTGFEIIDGGVEREKVSFDLLDANFDLLQVLCGNICAVGGL